MSELQSESGDIQESTPVIENPDNGAELAPASESEHGTNTEVVEEVESEASKQQKYINKQYGVTKQLERDVASRDVELEGFRKADRERQAATVGNIPPMPTDQFEDDYDEKLQAHINGVRAQERYNTTNDAYMQQQQFTQQQAAQETQRKQAELGNSFTANAKKAGATDEEFNDVVMTLNNGGMTGDIGNAIMSDPDGYFIAKHLAANPMEAHELNTMNPILAGAKFAELKQKASALKNKTTNAPAPTTDLTGKGADKDAGKYQNIKGATFE